MVAKELCVRGELETERTATYWPPALPAISALLSHSAGLFNQGSLRATSPLSGSWFSLPRTATNLLELTELLVAPGYIIVWHPPASCERHICTEFNLSTVKGIPWYLRPDAPVPWSTTGSEVNMLHMSLEECRVPLHCHRFEVHSDQESSSWQDPTYSSSRPVWYLNWG